MSALQRMLDAQSRERRGRRRRQGRQGGRGPAEKVVSVGWREAELGKARACRWWALGQPTVDGRRGARCRGRGHGDHNRGRHAGSNGDRIYANIYAEINRRAREKAATFLTAAGSASSAHDAHERAIQAEEELLRSWVGELQPRGSTGDDATKPVCEYFQDRTKQYPFYCGAEGHALLQRLLSHNVHLLRANMKLVLEQGDPQFVMAQGELIYELKPSLKAYNKTWSQDEYGHPGLQRTYIKLKSFQRFTETWATMERAAAEGLFDEWKESGKSRPLRVASIGGGPGYELLAMQMFFERFAPGVQLELVSLDLCPSWRKYVETLGYRFEHWDIRSGGLLEKLGMAAGDLDYVIISYVLIYCTDNATMDMLAGLLRDGRVKAIIVSERSERTPGVDMMAARGITVKKLMDQSPGLTSAVILSRTLSPSGQRATGFCEVPFVRASRTCRSPSTSKRGRKAGTGWVGVLSRHKHGVAPEDNNGKRTKKMGAGERGEDRDLKDLYFVCVCVCV